MINGIVLAGYIKRNRFWAGRLDMRNQEFCQALEMCCAWDWPIESAVRMAAKWLDWRAEDDLRAELTLTA
jgi:hypothetical protein